MTVRCALGRLLVAATAKGLCAVKLGDTARAWRPICGASSRQRRLSRIGSSPRTGCGRSSRACSGHGSEISLPLDVRGTAFQWRVWRALKRFQQARPVPIPTLPGPSAAVRRARGGARLRHQSGLPGGALPSRRRKRRRRGRLPLGRRAQGAASGAENEVSKPRGGDGKRSNIRLRSDADAIRRIAVD